VAVDGSGENVELSWFYQEASQPSQALRAFGGSDLTQRYVVFQRDSALVLRDSLEHTETNLSDLGADATDDSAPYRAHRSVAFAPDAATLAVIQRGAGEVSSIKLLDLTQHTTRTFRAPLGLPWRISLPPGSKWLQVESIVTDSNRNGRLDWPFPRRRTPAACPLPIASYPVWNFAGDAPTRSLIHLESGEALELEGLLTTFGRGYIQRNELGALTLVPSFEKRNAATQLSDAACLGRLYWVDSSRGTLIFGCAAKSGERRQLYLLRNGVRQALNMDVAAFETDANDAIGAPLLPLYPHNDSLILDLDTGRLHALPEGTRVLGVHGKRALAERASKLLFLAIEGDSVTETPLPGARNPLDPLIQSGGYLSLGARLFDLSNAQMVGIFPERPLALSDDGKGLLPTRVTGSLSLPLGPLFWAIPK
jgi:hypothetical protein